MSERKNLMFAIVLAVIIATTVFVIVTGNAAKPDNTLTDVSIGIVDYAQAQEKLVDFVRLKDLLKAYDAELNSFAALKRQEAANYYAELEKKQEEEKAGKSADEAQDIEKKYEKLAQEKATEISQIIQAKKKELEEKFNAERVKADERLRQHIAAVSADKKLKLVLTKAAVYYGGVDVTADVIAKGNAPTK
jgi:Skp family chaperone for outer membrane proteins